MPSRQRDAGHAQKHTFEITGNKLTIPSASGKNAAGQDVTFTIVLERVE